MQLENLNSNHTDKDPIPLSNTQNNPLNNKEVRFSYFKLPIKNTLPYKAITLNDVVKAIKGDRAKTKTESLRAIKDVDDAKHYKAHHFDYATFSGTFSQRKTNALIEYSGLIALDFDHVNVHDVKKMLLTQTDVDTVLLFTSPSGDGIKWIVPSTNKEEHGQVFRMYQRYCKDILDLEVDESGKDIARACFIPYDENVVLNEVFEFRKLEKFWNDLQSELPPLPNSQRFKRKSGTQFDGISPFDDYSANGDIVSLLQTHGWRKCEAKTEMISFTRPGKKSGISANFRLSDRILYVFTNSTVFEGSKGYNPAQVFTTLECGGDNIVARRKLLKLGYGEESKPSYFSDHALNEDKKHGNLNFYTDDFKISASRLAEFNKQKGFMRISEEGNDIITIIKNNNKILKPFNHKTDTIAFLKEHINHSEKRVEIENLLVTKRNVIQNSFELMKGEPYNLHKDKKDATYIPFANGVCKITKDCIEMIDYKSKEIAFFIDKIKSQQHHFKITDIAKREISDFEKFIIYAIIGRETDDFTHNEQKDIRAFYSMIGYLISNYKNPAESPAIILSDEDAVIGERRGARGKSLLAEAVRKVKGSIFKDATKFNPAYTHVYADLERYHDIYILDDATERFKYDTLYTDITGDITAQRKGTSAVTIPFEDAPKFVITTNAPWRFDKDADSTNRRFVEYQFSNYWKREYTPEMFFGYRFFDDWDDEQWQLFYEFLIACSMQFLTTGLQRISYAKDKDNYRGLFSNDVIEHEFERIFLEMKTKSSFNVTDFLDEHDKKPMFRFNNKLFHRQNARKHIDAYLIDHKIEVDFSKKEKRWYFKDIIITPSNDTKVDNDLPF